MLRKQNVIVKTKCYSVFIVTLAGGRSTTKGGVVRVSGAGWGWDRSASGSARRGLPEARQPGERWDKTRSSFERLFARPAILLAHQQSWSQSVYILLTKQRRRNCDERKKGKSERLFYLHDSRAVDSQVWRIIYGDTEVPPLLSYTFARQCASCCPRCSWRLDWYTLDSCQKVTTNTYLPVLSALESQRPVLLMVSVFIGDVINFFSFFFFFFAKSCI